MPGDVLVAVQSLTNTSANFHIGKL